MRSHRTCLKTIEHYPEWVGDPHLRIEDTCASEPSGDRRRPAARADLASRGGGRRFLNCSTAIAPARKTVSKAQGPHDYGEP